MAFCVQNGRKGVVRGCSYGAFPKLGVFLGGCCILRSILRSLYLGKLPFVYLVGKSVLYHPKA